MNGLSLPFKSTSRFVQKAAEDSVGWIMKYGFDEEEALVIEWQYGFCGDFKRNLWHAICRADEESMARLECGFPYEVTGYLKYTQQEGWWRSVRERWLRVMAELKQKRGEDNAVD